MQRVRRRALLMRMVVTVRRRPGDGVFVFVHYPATLIPEGAGEEDASFIAWLSELSTGCAC
jgi:hypothetical protein